MRRFCVWIPVAYFLSCNGGYVCLSALLKGLLIKEWSSGQIRGITSQQIWEPYVFLFVCMIPHYCHNSENKAFGSVFSFDLRKTDAVDGLVSVGYFKYYSFRQYVIDFILIT
jgi:hypothetical protein